MDSKFRKVEGIFTVVLRSKDNVNFVIKQIVYLRQCKMLKIEYPQDQMEVHPSLLAVKPLTKNHLRCTMVI